MVLKGWASMLHNDKIYGLTLKFILGHSGVSGGYMSKTWIDDEIKIVPKNDHYEILVNGKFHSSCDLNELKDEMHEVMHDLQK
jgi:hypothetical protein